MHRPSYLRNDIALLMCLLQLSKEMAGRRTSEELGVGLLHCC